MTYNVWSLVGTTWIVVGTGNKKQALANAARRQAKAEVEHPDGVVHFVALPEGEVPA